MIMEVVHAPLCRICAISETGQIFLSINCEYHDRDTENVIDMVKDRMETLHKHRKYNIYKVIKSNV